MELQADIRAALNEHSKSGVWVIDFEFEIEPGQPLPKRVVCMVGRELYSGQMLKLQGSSLNSCPPEFKHALMVAHYAIAEALCFLRLEWPLPDRWLDTWAEEKRLTVGSPGSGVSLLDCLRRAGLSVRDETAKKDMQTLIGEGRWSPADMPAILDYCTQDVDDTAALLCARLPQYLSQAPTNSLEVSLGQAIVRGAFCVRNAEITHHGIPFDAPLWRAAMENFDAVKLLLIEEVDREFGVYEGTTFKHDKFRKYLQNNNMSWPIKPVTDALELDENTFKSMAAVYPQITVLHELRQALSAFRNNGIRVDADNRVRADMRPFGSKTGRSQPSNSKYIFGQSRWARSFIKPAPGMAIAYLDFVSQEIAIAAGLSRDSKLLRAYDSGDPYMRFAIDAGLAPEGATKGTHPDVRKMCKTIVLGVQYGMGAESMAVRGGMLVSEARRLLMLHKETYQTFWAWTERQQDLASLGEPAYTPMGWRIVLGYGADVNRRSSGNWPIQSTGSDILRVAVILLAEQGIKLIGTVHDAVLIESPAAQIDQVVAEAQLLMTRAAVAVCGVKVRVDAHVVRYPDRYVDENAGGFFNRLVGKIQEVKQHAE